MLRRGVATALLVGALLSGLGGCGSDDTDASAPPAATVAPKAVSGEERREKIYLEATAAHLCAVQSRVYTDPGEMASAYASRPRYEGLTADEVAAFDQRRTTDPDFARRLAETITATCSVASPSD